MQIVKGVPPNWADIGRHFDVEGKDVVFTFGDTIYNPQGSKISEHLQAHEEVHSVQQGSFPGGPEAWWQRYIIDPEFRLQQEAEAYGMQMHVGGRGKIRSKKRDALEFFARVLSGPIYDKPCTFDRAKELIKDYLAKIA